MAAVDGSSWPQSGTPVHPAAAAATASNNYNMPPSKVIHCRAVAEGCKETDLVQVMKLFGNIKALKLMPKISQGLVEFEELESAIACVTYSQLQPILVHGRQMYVNYSKSSEINRQFTNSSVGQTPTKILLLTIINVIHPVNVDIIKKICAQQTAEPQRIVIFHKNGLQALVEFLTVEEAEHVQQTLNGCDIFPGCCTLKIEYSKTEKLNVHVNTSESYDIEIEKKKALKNYPSFENGKDGNMSAILAGAEGYPAVQSILAKVMAAGGPSSVNQGNAPGMKSLLSGSMEMMDPNAANRTTLLPGQQPYMDPYSSPFGALGDGISSAGGEGCVAMVYGIDNQKMNCNHLFNLFCQYGNVVKVKILVNKPGAAMIQYSDRMSTDIAIRNLNNLTVFGQQVMLSFSKHPFIVDSSQVSAVFDGSPSVVSFLDSKNNRFKYVPGKDLFSRIYSPSKVLHYYNSPPDCTEERILEIFQSFSAPVPLKHATISKSTSKSASGLLEFSDVNTAVEAMILVNHVTLHKGENIGESLTVDDKPGAPFTFKLAFSPSDSINK